MHKFRILSLRSRALYSIHIQIYIGYMIFKYNGIQCIARDEYDDDDDDDEKTCKGRGNNLMFDLCRRAGRCHLMPICSYLGFDTENQTN